MHVLRGLICATELPPECLILARSRAGRRKVRISRKIWGGFVFALGLLWLVGGAFGYFEVTHDITEFTKAVVFDKVGRKTRVVRWRTHTNTRL